MLFPVPHIGLLLARRQGATALGSVDARIYRKWQLDTKPPDADSSDPKTSGHAPLRLNPSQIAP
jgi:hypothetical protein